MNVLQLFVEVFLQELHERRDFCAGALPVFDGKRIERQDSNPEFGRTLYNLSNGIDPRAMPCYARHPALACPAPVSVHDDRDMGRQSASIDLQK